MVLKRYIDDMFIAWMSNTITAEKLLSTANNLNSALKFTIAGDAERNPSAISRYHGLPRSEE